MLFRQLFDSTSCTYTYLIASDYGREAMIIDPVQEHLGLYNQLLTELQVKLVMSLETHTHADHITAAGPLSKHHSCPIAMGETTQAEHVSLRLKEGEVLSIDGIQLEAIYTPGHTPDSFSFCMEDRIFTGDTLLIRGTGRTDFQAGDPFQQYDSLFNKLLTLPDHLLVFPAHDYKGMTVSTIREEKNHNPRLQVKNSKEYASIMNSLSLAPPKMIDIAVPANLKCGL